MSQSFKFDYSLLLYFVLVMFCDATCQWKKHGNCHREERVFKDTDPKAAEGDLLKESIGVFKGGPDTYLLTFAEVRPRKQTSIVGEDAFDENLFPPLWPNKSVVRRRRKGDSDEDVTVSPEVTSISSGSRQAEVQHSSGEAEEVVSSVLKATENVRKSLGVCRKYVPRNFFNPPLDNRTAEVIKSITGCVEEKLQDDLSCYDCITIHEDMRAFLNWMIHGNPGLACCPSIRKTAVPEDQKHMFLFRQEAFGGSHCATGSSDIQTVCETVTYTHSPIVTHPNKKMEPKRNFIRVV